MAKANRLAEKHFRTINTLYRRLVVTENSHQLIILFVGLTCTVHQSSQPSAMPGSNSSVRPSLALGDVTPNQRHSDYQLLQMRA